MTVSGSDTLVMVMLQVSLALRGVSMTLRRLRGVNMVLTLSRPRSMLPNIGVRLLGVSIRWSSLSTDWDLLYY